MLEIQQRFEPTLGNLRLIRRVSGVPTGVFQHVAQDDGRRERAVVAHADQAGPDLILLGVATQPGQRRLLIQRWRQIQCAIKANAWGHGLLDQFTSATKAEAVEHGLLLGGVGTEMAAQEGLGIA